MDTALVQPKSVCDEALGILSRLGAPQNAFAREGVMALSPITGELIAQVRITSHLPWAQLRADTMMKRQPYDD